MSDPEITPARVEQHAFHYDGQTGTIYRIWFLNILLNVVTLGIHSFWGRTRLRRYAAANFALAGDRLEYVGTGKELFKGFLTALPVIILLYAPLVALPPEEYPATTLVFIPIAYFIYVGLFAAMRYRLSRTLWRGIRGRLTGSAFAYGGVVLATLVLNIVTLGVMIPWSDRRTTGYLMRRVRFGDSQATFTDDAKDLWRIHFITIAIPLLIAVGVGVLIYAAGGLTEEGDGAAFIPLTVIVVFAIARIWYRAALTRYQFNNLHIAGLRFAADQTGGEQAKLLIGNLLIIILTLGLGRPFVMQRDFRFIARHISLHGDVNAAAVHIQQSRETLSSTGEGLDGILGAEAGVL